MFQSQLNAHQTKYISNCTYSSKIAIFENQEQSINRIRKLTSLEITIVIPNYNHAKYLPRAINSALNQTMQPTLILIIDDGSNDDSVSIIEKFRDQHPIIKFCKNEKNIGVMQTISNVIRQVTTTHIIFLAADDWLLPNFIAETCAVLERYPQAAFCSSDTWTVIEDEDHKLLANPLIYPIKSAGFIDPKLAQKMLYKIDSWFAGNTVLYNLDILRKEHGPNIVLDSFADNFLYRVLATKYGCCFIPKRLSVWRIRKNSMSQTSMSSPTHLKTIFSRAMNLTKTNYVGIFTDEYLARMDDRLSFDLAKAIWIYSNFVFGSSLKELLQARSPNFWYKIIEYSLRIAQFLPFGKKYFGMLVLYMYFRCYDLHNLLKMRAKLVVGQIIWR